MAESLRMLGLCGSLRAASFNRGLLHATQHLLSDRVLLEIPGLAGFPEFNEDIAANAPESVTELKRVVGDADVLLFATAEYNYGLPGWFKNVIDWLSWPPTTTPLRHKPAGLVTASAGERGGARAQLALRASLVYTDTYVMSRPEMFVGRAGTKFDAAGRLHDEPTRQELQRYLAALLDWTRLLSGR
jgi:chromate reductase, NAD(P)H dehydrogenase (quinone)